MLSCYSGSCQTLSKPPRLRVVSARTALVRSCSRKLLPTMSTRCSCSTTLSRLGHAPWSLQANTGRFTVEQRQLELNQHHITLYSFNSYNAKADCYTDNPPSWVLIFRVCAVCVYKPVCTFVRNNKFFFGLPGRLLPTWRQQIISRKRI